MSEYTTFTAKDVDAAINQACSHFDVERERLEIEILSGGSSGIFGLMGKKAQVRARLRPTGEKPKPASGQSILADLEARTTEPKPAPEAPQDAPAQEQEQPAKPKPQKPKGQEQGKKQSAPKGRAPHQPKREDKREDKRPPKKQRPPRAPRSDKAPRPQSARPDYDPANEPDVETLNAEVRKVLEKLLAPIIGETEMEFSNEPGRVKVLIKDDDNSGLIIGREGQTITALQYIANRIVARKLQTAARVHLDAGDYRTRQDENLQNMAIYLADKAKNQNRTQSTKPLSSYHRRLVHLALQDDETIATSSKGDGPLKRVLIHPRRNNQRG